MKEAYGCIWASLEQLHSMHTQVGVCTALPVLAQARMKKEREQDNSQAY